MKKWISITLNLHQNDCQLFEDWLLLILNWLESDQVFKYSYAIEKDGTVDRHLHCIVEVDMRDAEKVFSRLTTVEFLVIKKNVKKSKSILAIALHCANVTKEHKKILGYVNKWHTPRRAHKGFTDDEIISAVEYYYTVERLEKTQDVTNDWIHVTNKNFHAIVEDYASKSQSPHNESGLLKLQMVKAGHTFQLNATDQERYFKELRIKNTSCTPDDEYTCANEAYGMKKEYDSYMEDDIKDLIKYIQSTSATGCTPDSLGSIYHKYQYLF